VIAEGYENIPERVFINPKLLHVTLIMLPLGEAGLLEKAREALRAVEPKIKELIKERGINGKLIVEFDHLEIFGTIDETRVVYMKLKENSDQFELLKEINALLIESLLAFKALQRKNLTHVTLNKET
jgi:2'-5' RNA ligase